MTTQELSTRLKYLSEAQREVSQLITRLSKLGTQANSAPQTSDEGDSRVELSSEIHQSLKEQEEELELLKQEVEDLTSSTSWGSSTRQRDNEKDRERITFVTQVERLGEDLKFARVQFRRAQLQAKRNAEAAKRKERELLFTGVQEGSTTAPGRRKGHGKVSQDELLVNASSDVTAALRRTHQLMQSELSRSRFAHDTLQQSTAALSSLNETYTTLDTLLSSSRSLISTLVSSQKSDTWYLETALWILIGTIGWLIFRRIFWLPYKAILLMLRVSLSALISFIGLFGGSSQSGGSAISSASQQISSSLVVQPSAKNDFPRFSKGMAAPSINVGVGGGGAKDEGRQQGEENLSDKIGKIAEESRQNAQGSSAESENNVPADQGTVLRERTADEHPNPKKRMFEEPPIAKEQQAERLRDEL